jgi:hypothetical protein
MSGAAALPLSLMRFKARAKVQISRDSRYHDPSRPTYHRGLHMCLGCNTGA